MKLLVYGGSFNPPHRGHVAALQRAAEHLHPDAIRVIPAKSPPHKELAPNSPGPAERLELTRLAFADVPGVTVSDMELHREGASYTVDTLAEIAGECPEADIWFLMGTDMFLYMEKWYDFRRILRLSGLVVLPRETGEEPAIAAHRDYLQAQYGARVAVLPVEPLPMDSTGLRAALCRREGVERLPGAVYEQIIRRRYYGARPQLSWLRERSYSFLKPYRIPHVAGCEEEAVKLAERWGADREDAAEAAILHDITKKLNEAEQLRLCGKYGIMTDNVERNDTRLLHARTGACVARDLFGVSQPVFDAIEWHTTGRPGMSLLEKIIYMADYIEPTRDFEGLEKLRQLAYADLDAAVLMGCEMSIEEMRERGNPLHPHTLEASQWLKGKRE